MNDLYETERMHLFTSEEFEGELTDCDEGELSWVSLDQINDLPVWEGDKIMFDYLFGSHKDSGFFTMKFRYEGDKLAEHWEKSW